MERLKLLINLQNDKKATKPVCQFLLNGLAGSCLTVLPIAVPYFNSGGIFNFRLNNSLNFFVPRIIVSQNFIRDNQMRCYPQIHPPHCLEDQPWNNDHNIIHTNTTTGKETPV